MSYFFFQRVLRIWADKNKGAPLETGKGSFFYCTSAAMFLDCWGGVGVGGGSVRGWGLTKMGPNKKGRI